MYEFEEYRERFKYRRVIIVADASGQIPISTWIRCKECFILPLQRTGKTQTYLHIFCHLVDDEDFCIFKLLDIVQPNAETRLRKFCWEGNEGDKFVLESG